MSEGLADGDWRLTVRFHEHQRVAALRALGEHAAAATVHNRVRHLVSVRREGPWLRMYATSYAALARVQQIVSAAARELDATAEERLERFDQGDGAWQQVDAPLVSEIESEHVRFKDAAPQWGAGTEEDRVTIQWEFTKRSDAIETATALRDAGHDAHRHWATVFLFAESRTAAEELTAAVHDYIHGEACCHYAGEGRAFWI
jgi:hypothetical protein